MACALLVLAPLSLARAEGLRLATWHVELSRKGPGLLLRDIEGGRDAQVAAVVAVIVAVGADVLALQGIDHDAGLEAAQALRKRVAAAGLDYPHLFALQPNSGLATGLDMDGDGRLGRARDAQGYGRFRGNGGMLILSRYPIDDGAARDFSGLLWRDLPGASLPVREDGTPFPSPEAQAVQRLSSVGHWAVPVEAPQGRITLLAWHATPPMFDGPEDRNGLRNADEARLWLALLDGALGPVPERPVLVGVAGIDPDRGEGRPEALHALIAHPALQAVDPAGAQGTATFRAGPDRAPLRLSRILPAAGLRIAAQGVLWPPEGDPMAETVALASRHRLVWVDVRAADASSPPSAPKAQASR